MGGHRGTPVSSNMDSAPDIYIYIYINTRFIIFTLDSCCCGCCWCYWPTKPWMSPLVYRLWAVIKIYKHWLVGPQNRWLHIVRDDTTATYGRPVTRARPFIDWSSAFSTLPCRGPATYAVSKDFRSSPPESYFRELRLIFARPLVDRVRSGANFDELLVSGSADPYNDGKSTDDRRS